ncbi:Uncharacterized protein CTYZ_00002482 [Cryptosporidium tyzzeri]|nr:Uncharacterized protein CTYZ_00002482 [Cryptosporidium tyzzeri]
MRITHTIPDKKQYLNSLCINNFDFEPCFIREITSKLINQKKYVKVLGIIVNIRKRPKFLELTIDDSSDILRAVFWGSRPEFQKLKLIRNFYTNSLNLGALVEARGIVESYNNTAQLKLFCINNVYNCNMESLWWLNIFEKFIKEKMSISIHSDNILNGELIKFSSFNKIGRFELTSQLNNQYFSCLCRRCHKIINTKLIPNNSRYEIISRMIVSALNRFRSLFRCSETNKLNEEDIQFIINRILITNCEINNALREVPMSCISCILNSVKEIYIKEFGYEVRSK